MAKINSAIKSKSKLSGTERRLNCLTDPNCSIINRQELLIKELEEVKVSLAELRTGVADIIELFEESKSAFKFFKRIGKFLRWAAVIVVSISAIWASIISWRAN